MPADGPTAEQAAALAKRMLLAWADRGFRDDRGNFPRLAAQYCQAGYPVVPTFTLSRGVIYSVEAQDLLMGLGALDHDEEARLTRFHEVIADLIRPLTNDEFAAVRRGKYRDEAYNNQFIADLTSELALARLFDDQQHFLAALYGGKGSESVTIPWVVLFDHVIYGPSDHPLIRVTPNNSPDPLTSKPAWSTLVVAAGEVNDRYRNDNPLQSAIPWVR